jgi:hypothetical protein
MLARDTIRTSPERLKEGDRYVYDIYRCAYRKHSMRQAGSGRTCAHCGTVNAATEQFCVNCGYELTSGPGSQGQAVSPPVAVVSTPGRRVTGALVPGALLGGRYRIVQALGKGGFGGGL